MKGLRCNMFFVNERNYEKVSLSFVERKSMSTYFYEQKIKNGFSLIACSRKDIL